MRKKIATFGIVAVLAMAATASLATEFEVQMLNRGTDGIMVFEPSLVQIEPGDTVHFVATDKGHNVESIVGMIPDGAEAIHGAMGQDLTMTFELPGYYGVKCTPHFALGMVGLIVVGELAPDVEPAEGVRLPRKAQQRFDAIFANLQ
jgi:pseudoazurin